jgi:asparagine synthase (glutamine-hydrolysing)
MCGIAGIILRENDGFEPVVPMEKMLNKIAHRGPDGSGVWESENQRLLLGHKRLSIVDLNEKAGQPLSLSSDYAITFNGEIYNHQELRKELEICNVGFVTDHSDTEVLLNGFVYWGIDKLLAKLNGMFAFAIYDRKKNNVVVCRDRVGIKSVYFSQDADKFIFCSEIKGILATECIHAIFDDANLDEYLLNRSLAAPNTLFKNIYKLQPATYITFDLDTFDFFKTVYWNPLDVPEDESIRSQKDVEEKLFELIDSSLDYRLNADVPIGMFLSGGIDSNYLLSRLSNKRSGIKCFNASFGEDNEFDESSSAKYMADKFGANLIDVPINEKNYLQALEDVIYFQEEPISAPVCVPVFLLSEAAKKHNIPVVLAGEGSDELFIGYQNWLLIRRAQKIVRSLPFARTLSKLTRNVAIKLINETSPIHDLLDRASKGLPLFWGGAMDMNYISRSRLLVNASSDVDQNSELYDKKIRGRFENYELQSKNSSDSRWMAYADLQQRLPELMLPRLDRMGMAHSIEGRVPFLDHRIIEFIFSVPEKVMLEQSHTGKSALKSIAAKTLGKDFVYRRKKGFQAPVSDWKDGLFKPWVELLVLFSERTSIFNVDGVNAIVEHGGRRYFTLVNFMIWYLIFIENVLKDKLPNLKSWDQY